MEKIELFPYDTSRLEEAEEVHLILSEYFKSSPYPSSIEKVMKGGIRFYRAMIGEKQVGISGFVQKTPTLAETVKTVIFNEHRGRGYGNLLSQAIEDECRKIGIKKVMTTIFSFNHQMIQIKLKQGYTIEGYHPDHEAPGFHEYSLGKILK